MDERESYLKDKIAKLRPKFALDVGCGSGKFTQKIAEFCEQVVAVDIAEAVLERAKEEVSASNVEFKRVDGRSLDFPDSHFDLVFCRACLHHIKDWEKVLDQMFRVSSHHVLIEEPLGDLRTAAKRNSFEVQQHLLELQKEVGFPHFNHLPLDTLLEYFNANRYRVELKIDKSDRLESFEQRFEEQFKTFIEKSEKKDMWEKRLADLKKQYLNRLFAESDVVFLYVDKLDQ